MVQVMESITCFATLKPERRQNSVKCPDSMAQPDYCIIRKTKTYTSFSMDHCASRFSIAFEQHRRRYGVRTRFQRPAIPPPFTELGDANSVAGRGSFSHVYA